MPELDPLAILGWAGIFLLVIFAVLSGLTLIV